MRFTFPMSEAYIDTLVDAACQPWTDGPPSARKRKMSKRISVAEQTLKKQIDRILADEMRIQNEIELRIHVGKELANQRTALEAEVLRLEVNRAAATPK